MDRHVIEYRYFYLYLGSLNLLYIENKPRLPNIKKRVISGYICKQIQSSYHYRYPISDKNAKKDKPHRIEAALFQQ